MSEVRKPKRAKGWTIYDIAKATGVSAKTVSRVLNDKPGVGAARRERIQALMKQVGYHPHMGARALRGDRQGCIGITLAAPLDVVPLSQGLLLWIFAELSRVFASQGEYLCFDLNPYKHGGGGDYARGVWAQLFKACVVVGPLSVDDQCLLRLHASGVPYLTFGVLESLPELSCAAVDYEEGAYVSTKHLVDRGHRRIGMLKAFSGFQPGVLRLRGYRRALEEAGIAFDERLVRNARFGADNIANMVHRILADRTVTALIDCSAAEDAGSIREGARRAGRRPGDNFEIVAWTYAENAAVLSEATATLWLPLREAAADGLEELARWCRGERNDPIHVVYHPVLNETVTGGEVPKPRRLFDLLD